MVWDFGRRRGRSGLRRLSIRFVRLGMAGERSMSINGGESVKL